MLSVGPINWDISLEDKVKLWPILALTDTAYSLPNALTAASSNTVKKLSEIFPQIVGQLKIQMGRKFFLRYSRKYFWHRTGNSSYCLLGKISSLLGKKDIFHNLSEKRFLKKWTNFHFCGIICAFHGKNFLQLRRFVKFSHRYLPIFFTVYLFSLLRNAL